MTGKSTLENTMPVIRSTWSRLVKRSTASRATSGFCWSSTTLTSAGRPPSLPPFSLTASRKASRMSTPSAPPGPDRVLRNPTLTLSAAWTGRANAVESSSADISFFMMASPRSHPRLKHVVVRSLRVHHVDALELDAMARLGLLQVMNIRAGEMAGRVVAELHHVEARAHDQIAASRILFLDGDVADDVIGAPRRLLRPGARVAEPLGSHGHQVAIFPEDRRHAVAGGLLGCRRHPVGAVLGEQIDEFLPALAVEALGLPVEELLDVAQRIAPVRLPEFRPLRRGFRLLLLLRHQCTPFMYWVQALNWLRIGCSDVPMTEVVTSLVSWSCPALRWKLTQSPPSDSRPLWHFQKFHRSSALTRVAGELTRL